MTRMTAVFLLTALGTIYAAPEITLEHLGTHATGLYDQVASEIGAHDPATQRVFVTNSAENTVDVLDLNQAATLPLLFQIPLDAFGAGPSSVVFRGGLGAVAVASEPKTDPGRVVFFRADGSVVTSVIVGALPDCLAFTPDGKKVVVANEGEPNDEYTVDPEGSISIIDVSEGAAGISQASVRTAGFGSFNGDEDKLRARGVRIYGPGASVAQDIEPEFVTVARDSRTAWVTLQENNALAIVDLVEAQVRKIVPLGFKLHFLPRNALDASDRDGAISIRSWPVRGMYLPDAIAFFETGGKSYLITANEGDTRDWDGFSEEERVGGLVVDEPLSKVADLQENENLGRLKVTNSPPDGKHAGAGPDGEDVYRKLYSFGGRSFSIWTTDGDLVFDSGDELERMLATRLGDDFNSDHISSPSGDSRSDDKGPEPEAVAVGNVGGRTYGFIGLERAGGVVIYDITNPASPGFVDYVNHRDFGVAFHIEDCAACEDDCDEDCTEDCESCKEACAECADCPPGEDCSEACARCVECTPTYGACPECTADCPAVASCKSDCTAECVAENCPQAGVEGRDPLDLGPEGVVFIPAELSPSGLGPLLIVTNEVSGSTTVFRVVSGDE
jgi:2',3'-cyclic-nucleotide 2'-phosphodiesterase / 3'-nucleotidase / 5'-nucleotidase